MGWCAGQGKTKPVREGVKSGGRKVSLYLETNKGPWEDESAELWGNIAQGMKRGDSQNVEPRAGSIGGNTEKRQSLEGTKKKKHQRG